MAARYPLSLGAAETKSLGRSNGVKKMGRVTGIPAGDCGCVSNHLRTFGYKLNLAERGGFEPPERFNPFNGLANRRFRPLSHLSCPGGLYFIVAKCLPVKLNALVLTRERE